MSVASPRSELTAAFLWYSSTALSSALQLHFCGKLLKHVGQGTYQGLHFNQGHFESMGHALCEILIDLVDPTQTKVEQIAREFREM